MVLGMRNIVGPRIKEARYTEGRRLTQHQLAARLQTLGVDLDRTAISKIESRRRPITDIEIIAICKALGIRVEDLFSDRR